MSIQEFLQMVSGNQMIAENIVYLKCRSSLLPNRVANVIDDNFVKRVMATLKTSGRLNLKANESNQYSLVIYPK